MTCFIEPKGLQTLLAAVKGVPVEVLNKGSVKNIHIQMEDRMGGRKHATKLSHVESFALDPNDLATELQRKFQVLICLTLLYIQIVSVLQDAHIQNLKAFG